MKGGVCVGGVGGGGWGGPYMFSCSMLQHILSVFFIVCVTCFTLFSLESFTCFKQPGYRLQSRLFSEDQMGNLDDSLFIRLSKRY